MRRLHVIANTPSPRTAATSCPSSIRPPPRPSARSPAATRATSTGRWPRRARRSALGDTFDGPRGALTAAQRGRLLQQLSLAVVEHGEELATLETRDTGKSLKTARSDAAALAAGNACVVKPAEDACLSILRIADIAADLGFPPGALNVVTGLGAEAGAALAAHPGVDHLSFTGSTATATRVAEAAAQRHCPGTLELGGKSPQIVFEDADLDEALPTIVNAIA